MTTNSPIDLATFKELQETAGADFVEELVDTFIEDAPRMLAALREAFAGGQADPFRRIAHSLKSNASTFGATALAAMARELELGGMPAEPAPLDALQTEYVRAAAALQGLCHG
ncbi:MAG: Hpt domain-containing protein [Burkholderiaceae bacterium]